jgi:hypothetical protein
MKSTLIRVLSIMTLASSLSAFALSDKAKNSTAPSGETKCAPASSERRADQDKGQSDNDQEKSRLMLIREQEKQWLHDLQYPSAG